MRKPRKSTFSRKPSRITVAARITTSICLVWSFVDIMFFKVIDDSEDLSGKLPLSLRANFGTTLEKLKVYLGSEKRFPRPGRDGYFDRVKASLPYLGFAGGDGKTPAMACDTWNYRYTASAVIDSDVLCKRSGSLELQKTDWDAVSPHTQARCTFLRLLTRTQRSPPRRSAW